MDERMRFVIRLKDGESKASPCREFGISRKTGCKILERYEQCGREVLTDRHRRPFRYANQLPAQVETAIVAAKRWNPHAKILLFRLSSACSGNAACLWPFDPTTAFRSLLLTDCFSFPG